MAYQYCIGFMLLLSCCLLEALPRPLNNEYDHGAGYFGRGAGGSEQFQFDGLRFGRGPLKDPMFRLLLNPTAYAISPKGIAIANPISNVVIARNTSGSIIHAPIASAIAGPGGIAHAQSDLNLYEYVTY